MSRYTLKSLKKHLSQLWSLESIKMGDSHCSLDHALLAISRLRLAILRLANNFSQAKESIKGLETAKSSQVSDAIDLPSGVIDLPSPLIYLQG
jgi:hypothetical protein